MDLVFERAGVAMVLNCELTEDMLSWRVFMCVGMDEICLLSMGIV